MDTLIFVFFFSLSNITFQFAAVLYSNLTFSYCLLCFLVVNYKYSIILSVPIEKCLSIKANFDKCFRTLVIKHKKINKTMCSGIKLYQAVQVHLYNLIQEPFFFIPDIFAKTFQFIKLQN